MNFPRKPDERPVEDDYSEDDGVQFKPFHKTYKITTFAMSVGMIYPNPKTELWRLTIIMLLILSVAPLATMMVIEIYYYWMSKDMVNIIRHIAVLGPFMLGFSKMLLMYHKRSQAKEILDEINRDYANYNNFSKEYKQIAEDGIKYSLIYSERTWTIAALICIMSPTTLAILLTVYNCTFKSEATKYMIHDLNKPFADPEERLESPFFEGMFVYTFYCSVMFVINFIGYDGFFRLAIDHACMKMDLYCKALENAFRDGENLHAMVSEVIREQCRMYALVDLIQDTFNIWLGVILVATLLEICTCLYQITEGYNFDLRYIVFVTGAVVHIYVPCRYAAKLKTMSFETSLRVYCCGWEHSLERRVTGLVQLMIARSQIPSEITGFNMFPFDMELFMSILQTSYSMFTLLKS